jgi:hypothetical protein
MLNSFKAWWDQPFNAQGSAWNWFLFFGLIILISFAWTRVLRLIADTTAAVV